MQSYAPTDEGSPPRRDNDVCRGGRRSLHFKALDRTLTESQVDLTAQLSDVRQVRLGGPHRVQPTEGPHTTGCRRAGNDHDD
jgi:hypothetical protein